MTFYEYAAWKKKTTLPDAVTMMVRAGISPGASQEVEVLRMVNRQ